MGLIYVLAKIAQTKQVIAKKDYESKYEKL